MTPSRPRTTRRRRLLLRLPLAACGGGFLFALLISCSPMPGHWGLQPGIERVHDLDEVQVTEHADLDAFLTWLADRRVHLYSSGGARPYTAATFCPTPTSEQRSCSRTSTGAVRWLRPRQTIC